VMLAVTLLVTLLLRGVDGGAQGIAANISEPGNHLAAEPGGGWRGGHGVRIERCFWRLLDGLS